MNLKLTVLPGDGIGPEVTSEAVRVLESVAKIFSHTVSVTSKDIGGIAYTKHKDPLPQDTIDACLAADAVLLGAVGGPAFDTLPGHLRPEKGLLRIRKALGVYANLRPAVCFAPLETSSPLRPEIVHGMDVLVVRELLGGLYFGEPRHIQGEPGSRNAVDTMQYGEAEIERIAHMAFKLARPRRKKVTSVDKANVLDCSRLWRDVVTRVGLSYPDVKLDHMLVDSAAMALVSRPTSFDVLLTENMFGDILSDQTGAIVGSLGILPSASVGGKVGLFEPIHGSAPDIAGKGIANPLGTILSAAMLLRYSFQLETEAVCIESAVADVLHQGFRTHDLAKPGPKTLSTSEMGDKVMAALPLSAKVAS